MKLYDYYRSSASYRVRIAVFFKQIDCELIHINLLSNSHLDADFIDKNPQHLLPLLEDGDVSLNQSLAILEYLEEKFPAPSLLPHDINKKMAVKAFALEIACEIHPLNNLRVLKYLKSDLKTGEKEKLEWYHHWLREGFASLESRVKSTHGKFCFGDSPSWADLCLIPQIYNALRFEFPMQDFPLLSKIYAHCLQQEYFIKASPEERVKNADLS